MISDLSLEFITVRLVKCNGLDLSLFQFDSDLTFAVFFFNADRTLYARYGTRSQHDADKDVSLQGLAATMRNVLTLHQNYPANAAMLARKQPVSIDQSTPEDFASLSHFKPNLDYQGETAKGCIHCHQIRDAKRFDLRKQNKPIPDSLLFPYPTPQTIGLEFDKLTRSTVFVIANSAAEAAGLKNGDEIDSFNQQQIASEADLRWALDQMRSDQSVAVVVNRDGRQVELQLQFPDNWRISDDISWRPTTWELRRMATGGMVLKTPSEEILKGLKPMGIVPPQMALVVDHVGQYGEHARAKNAGIQKGDIILKFDGRADFQSESELVAYALQQKQPGDEVSILYSRYGDVSETKIILQ